MHTSGSSIACIPVGGCGHAKSGRCITIAAGAHKRASGLSEAWADPSCLRGHAPLAPARFMQGRGGVLSVQHALQDPAGQDKATLARVLAKVSSRASHASMKSSSGVPDEAGGDDSAAANRRSTFTDLASPEAAETAPKAEEDETVEAMMATMSEVRRCGGAPRVPRLLG